jgi:hypothetical protein
MPPKSKKPAVELRLIQAWPLTAAATLGSAVRAKGILLEMRARLPMAVRKSLDVEGAELVLRMAEADQTAFDATVKTVTDGLVGIETLPVIPREIEDILTIKTSERHRWLKDGRLPSAGTRTVKLRGRARQITFHVFDPRVVEDLLNRDMMDTWREEDAIAAAEKRRMARFKAALVRADKKRPKAADAEEMGRDERTGHKLSGFDDFLREGLLHD